MHSEDKVYQCSHCDKAFKQKPNLFAHQVTHLSFGRKSKNPRKSGNHADNDKNSEPMQNPSHTAKYLTKQTKLDSRIGTNKWSVTETANHLLSNDEDLHNAPHNESSRMFVNMVTDEIREILYQGLCVAHKHLTPNRFSTETPNGINPNKDRNEGNHYINPNKDRNEANSDINPNKDRNEGNHHINPNKDNIDTKNNINSNLDITEGQNDIIPKSDSHNRINNIAQEELNKNFTLTIPPEGVDHCEASQKMATDHCPLTGSTEILSNMHDDGSNINILQNKDLMDDDVNEFVEHLQIPSPQGSEISYGKYCYTNERLTKHLNWVHRKDESYQCGKCEKSFKFKVTLNEHLKTHYEKQLYKCYHCDKTYKKISYFIQHILTTHSKLSPEKPMPVKEMNKLPCDDQHVYVPRKLPQNQVKSQCIASASVTSDNVVMCTNESSKDSDYYCKVISQQIATEGLTVVKQDETNPDSCHGSETSVDEATMTTNASKNSGHCDLGYHGEIATVSHSNCGVDSEHNVTQTQQNHHPCETYEVPAVIRAQSRDV